MTKHQESAATLVLGIRAARQRLKIQARPYFTQVNDDGLSLGYRRTKKQSGTWIARAFDVEHGYRQKAMGKANDSDENVGMIGASGTGIVRLTNSN